jgi:ligand-binding sensor domain-containing protein
MRPTHLVLALCLYANLVTAQPLSFNFQKVTTAQGLNKGGITAISEDKYGYVWLGTSNGLNRYDGYGVKVYEHRFRDTTSLMPSGIRYAYCDSEGRFWISFMNGLMEYDYAKDNFREYGRGTMDWVTNIIESKSKQLFLATGAGLVKLNTDSGALTYFDSLATAGRGWNSQVWEMTRHQNELYLTTRSGLVVFNLDTETHRQIELPAELKGIQFNKIAVHPNGDVWIGSRQDNTPIYRTTTRFDTWKAYNDLNYAPSGEPNTITDLFIDRQGRLWAGSNMGGIAMYDSGLDKFRAARIEPWMPNGIISPYMGRIYQDRKGMLWAESFKGACYFNPDNAFFHTFFPGNKADASDERLAAFTTLELPDGRLWIGTGEGLGLFDPKTEQYQRYFNEPGKPSVLHHNGVRSLCLDRRGDLWICTTKGMNRLRAGAEKIEFLDERDGLPLVLTFAVHESRDGTIWVGNFGAAGHYYLPPGETKFRPLNDHPVLKQLAGKFGHSIFEDSQDRIWFGLDGLGLMCYDQKNQKAYHWQRTPENDSTLAGNYVHSICEDAKGMIWAGTSMGLSSIDPETFRFTNYDMARGLPTNRVTAALADQQNRIWIGSGQGLLLLDSTRQLCRQFDLNDGLPETDFINLPAHRWKDGRFVFPTRRGFVLFRPDKYNTQQPEPTLLLSSVRVFNQNFATQTNYENLQDLYLPPGKNFFTLELTALHYANPRHIWYAYKMEPYDQKWTFTRERTANYTDVPGGSYTFRYKATTDPNNWNVPEKTLRIRVGEHWYLAKWFWGIVVGLFAALGFIAFRRRSQLQEAFLSLERKAQALAKEKALVQYENLTQQLNPHFLFNSLASLGSLIRFDPKTASEFLEALSKMYRYILLSRDRETVSLQEEAVFAAHFLKLQQTRFGEALQIRINIDDQHRDRKIVPVTLQNLLENALKHNTLDNEAPLIVDIFTENDYLVVRNNLQRRTLVESSNKQGLSRLQTLYEYLSDTPMRIEETNEYFIVKIPLI